MDRLLTDLEVKELTGYSRTREQSNWLSGQKVLHFVNGENKVKVTWYQVNHPLHTEMELPRFENVS